MDLFDFFRACVRRWYVLLPMLLVSAWIAHNNYVSVKPVYYSQAVMGLSAPNSQAVQSRIDQELPHNGLIDLGGPSLITTMTVLGLRDPVVLNAVVAKGGAPNFGVRVFPSSVGYQQLPLIMIDASEPDPDTAAKTVNLVVEQVEPVLRGLQLQAGVPESVMVKPVLAAPPSAPAKGVPSRTQSTIAVAAAAVGVSLLITVVLDVFLLRRRQNTGVGRLQTAAET